MANNVLILQPPLVQLNTPYPSGAYLSAFFKEKKCNVLWKDLGVELFNSIFCRDGIKKLFDLTENKARSLIEKAEKNGDSSTAFELTRYISTRSSWENFIDSIILILKDSSHRCSRSLCHKLIFSPFAPRGHRMDSFLENLGHDLTVDDSRMLCTMALADLADYISTVFDSEFSLIRYAERLSIDESDFKSIEEGLNSPVLKTYLEPILQKLSCENEDFFNGTPDKKTLVCISVPFAGTFAASLYIGRFLKEKYGTKIFVSLGGGFVNTELRETEEIRLHKYLDALSFDRGYAGYDSLFKSNLLSKKEDVKNLKSYLLYKTRLFSLNEVSKVEWTNRELENYEDIVTSSLVPDYSDIDFSQYLSMADDTNPMQRLWSDGTWLKAYLSHGCYWHKCAFCDVTLDYVCHYRPTKTEVLFNGLLKQCNEHGLSGLHFVDEALPPMQLKEFALLNVLHGNSLSYWGNIRFEKIFTRDLAEFLSYAGLLGVSGGIEIATGSGLESINKGTDIDSIVSSCCAFKESGILVHAYLIYGWYSETEQDLINSMETLRQIYEQGLLDSSFWHKFVLTRHSKIYSEWKKGLHTELKPIENEEAGMFSHNGLHFEGEEKSEKYSQGLNASLDAWMHGKALQNPVGKWFNFKTVSPTIPKDFIASSIGRYEKKRDALYNASFNVEKLYFLTSLPVLYKQRNSIVLVWHYMQQEESLEFNICEKNSIENILEFLENLIPQKRNIQKAKEILDSLSPKYEKILHAFRGKGLVQL